jgi:DNA-directed RNA polymerase specialized sigma24 family protein
MLVLLESLSPEQRAVLVLHDVFDYAYPEIAGIVGNSEGNVPLFASRARRHVEQRRAGRVRFQTTSE